MSKTLSANSALSIHEIELLRSALKKNPNLNRAWLFGSRAKGIAKLNSDIDIAIEGLRTALAVESLRESLNNLPLPYAIDVQAIETIKNSYLRDHILRCGLRLFKRELYT